MCGVRCRRGSEIEQEAAPRARERERWEVLSEQHAVRDPLALHSLAGRLQVVAASTNTNAGRARSGLGQGCGAEMQPTRAPARGRDAHVGELLRSRLWAVVGGQRLQHGKPLDGQSATQERRGDAYISCLSGIVRTPRRSTPRRCVKPQIDAGGGACMHTMPSLYMLDVSSTPGTQLRKARKSTTLHRALDGRLLAIGWLSIAGQGQDADAIRGEGIAFSTGS
ncbi:hypothetical protein DFH09DRAFT_325076 [Mycena vulgaris]|nr:hypothetical protein DFH09DRAFT_325076 [Mycena vulgaris]